MLLLLLMWLLLNLFTTLYHNCTVKTAVGRRQLRAEPARHNEDLKWERERKKEDCGAQWWRAVDNNTLTHTHTPRRQTQHTLKTARVKGEKERKREPCKWQEQYNGSVKWRAIKWLREREREREQGPVARTAVNSTRPLSLSLVLSATTLLTVVTKLSVLNTLPFHTHAHFGELTALTSPVNTDTHTHNAQWVHKN